MSPCGEDTYAQKRAACQYQSVLQLEPDAVELCDWCTLGGRPPGRRRRAVCEGAVRGRGPGNKTQLLAVCERLEADRGPRGGRRKRPVMLAG